MRNGWNNPVYIFNSCLLYFFQVLGSGAFELKLNSFINHNGLNAEKNCCDGVKDHSGVCTSVCRTFFKICLKQYQSHITTDSTCTFGSFTTPVIAENSFTLSDTVNNEKFNISPLKFSFAWPVSIDC